MAEERDVEVLPCADCVGEGFSETMVFIRTEPDGAKRFECPRGHSILFRHP
jgi:hypothetical protein